MAKNIEINVKQNENYELLYPKSTSNIIVPSQALVDRFGNISSIDDAIMEAGLLPQLTVNTTPGAIIVVSKGDMSMSGIAGSDGSYVFGLYDYGTWTRVCTYGELSAQEEFEVTTVGQFSVDVITDVTLTVNTVSGATVTATNGNHIETGTAQDGKAVLRLGYLGNWDIKSTYLGVEISSNLSADKIKVISTNLYFTLSMLSWEQISIFKENGNVFNVNDYKQIVLNGTTGGLTFNNVTAYAIVIGNNHNASREGNNLLHFQLSLDTTNTKLLRNAKMNNSNSNLGGWRDSRMRTTICANFVACLPVDLQNILKIVTKYTDNGVNNKNITATQDKIFLLSEFEVFGETLYSFSGEKDYQQQYQWYKNHNTSEGRIKYKHNSSQAEWWWERSPSSDSSDFCFVDSNGGTSYLYATGSIGFAPCFCV